MEVKNVRALSLSLSLSLSLYIYIYIKKVPININLLWDDNTQCISRKREKKENIPLLGVHRSRSSLSSVSFGENLKVSSRHWTKMIYISKNLWNHSHILSTMYIVCHLVRLVSTCFNDGEYFRDAYVFLYTMHYNVLYVLSVNRISRTSSCRSLDICRW